MTRYPARARPRLVTVPMPWVVPVMTAVGRSVDALRRCAVQFEQRLSHAHRVDPDPQSLGEAHPRRHEGNDGGAVLEPAHLLAALEPCGARDVVGSAIPQVQQHVQEVQADARDQDGGDRHQRDEVRPRARVGAG